MGWNERGPIAQFFDNKFYFHKIQGTPRQLCILINLPYIDVQVWFITSKHTVPELKQNGVDIAMSIRTIFRILLRLNPPNQAGGVYLSWSDLGGVNFIRGCKFYKLTLFFIN